MKPIIAETTREKKALRPKARAAPKEPQDTEMQSASPVKPLVENTTNEEVYAVSNTRGKWTKHWVGQAAWGIPLDQWNTLCGWNFAKKNVKVELTKRPSRATVACKKCQKVIQERDGVKRAMGARNPPVSSQIGARRQG